MSTDMNRINIIGRLTKDPELKYTPNETAVANFSIANGRTHVKDGEKKEYTSFFNCVAWGKLGEVITQYCKKGHRIGLDGRLQQRSWDDSDGKKQYAVEIVVENMQFLQPKGESSSTSDAPMSDDDIPF